MAQTVWGWLSPQQRDEIERYQHMAPQLHAVLPQHVEDLIPIGLLVYR